MCAAQPEPLLSLIPCKEHGHANLVRSMSFVGLDQMIDAPESLTILRCFLKYRFRYIIRI
ncbi:MAG: hypothetical protein D6690_07320 [Nitrospirae bacterium]|nr:MAG: hypothetical protein D6690_07320 [Nitrospirota bacterium]